MNSHSWWRRLPGTMVLPGLLGLCLLASGLPAQEGAPPAGTVKAEGKERAKPRGRLPAYYGDVVSREQKEKIYDIQQQFAEQIQKLQAQLQQLELQRDMEVAAVLTDEQKQRVAELVAARAKQRKGSADSSSSPPADE